MAGPTYNNKRRTRDLMRANVQIDNMLKIHENDLVDTGNVSMKMMQKMGWNPGDGLGANKQGMSAPIQLKRNLETRGLGFGRKTGTEQMHHAGAFEKFQNVLDFLNSEPSEKEEEKKTKKKSKTKDVKNSDSNEKTEIRSLEAVSKKAKGRVHYQKFTRGKDVSRYSADEMAFVLGSKAFSLFNDLQSDDEDKKFVNSDKNSVEYFQSAKSSCNSPKLNSDGNSSEENGSSDGEQMDRPSFGGTSEKIEKEGEQPSFSFYSNFQSNGFINTKENEDGSEESSDDDEQKTNNIMENNLKEKYKGNYMSAFVKSENLNNDNSDKYTTIETEDTIEVSEKLITKKKKKSKKESKSVENCVDVSIDVKSEEATVEDSKKIKKEKKSKNENNTPIVDNNDELTDSKIKKKKKKKKSSKSVLLPIVDLTDVPSPQIIDLTDACNGADTDGDCVEIIMKTSKKKLSVQNEPSDSKKRKLSIKISEEVEIKSKKKKHKINAKSADPDEKRKDSQTESPAVQEGSVSEEIVVKKKKKSKK